VTHSETWNAPAKPEEVGRLRAAVVAFADAQSVSDPPLSDLRLAVSEAITNVVVHAYRDRTPGTVTVTATVDPERHRVDVVIADHGDGLRPRPDSPGMGLGLALMSRMSDDLEVREGAEGQGTEVHLSFTLGRDDVLS
jgi:anti-sigma regulatory factor (Ser/Thr protein kinase)